MKRFFVFGFLGIAIIFSLVIWWRYYFVFGEGVKSGELNFFVKKGFIFKTYEGRLIQAGFRAAVPGSIQSNEFEFSVANDSVAAKLERCSGKTVELRYVEYLGTLPNRGMSNFVVIEVLHVGEQ